MRHVIVQFTQRARSVEDDQGFDGLQRVLWPKIQQARKDGRRLYYRCGSAYINGHIIT